MLILTVNIILTLGSERLYSDMQRRFSSYKISTSEEITIIKLDKSGGCVDRDDTYMQQMREAALREYFFGNAKHTLSPHTQYVSFDELTIYKIFEGRIFYLPRYKLTNEYPSASTYVLSSRRRRSSGSRIVRES